MFEDLQTAPLHVSSKNSLNFFLEFDDEGLLTDFTLAHCPS